MRIIKRVEPKGKSGRFTCGTCKSVYEWEESDIHSDQRDGSYVICPVCKAFANVSKGYVHPTLNR